MKRFLVIALVPAVLLVLASTVLVARSDHGGGDGDEGHDTSAAERPATTSATRARPAPSPTIPTITAAPMAAVAPAPADDPHFVCPDGGMDAVVALQQAWEDGHQPWPGSAPDVAAACTFGVPESLVEPVGPHRYQVTHTTAIASESAIVELAQPLGPGTIWVAVEITYTSSGIPHAPCTEAAILPSSLTSSKRPRAGRCTSSRWTSSSAATATHGPSRSRTTPDAAIPAVPASKPSRCSSPTTPANGGYLTSGTGIACEADDDLFPALLAACQALGLRP